MHRFIWVIVLLFLANPSQALYPSAYIKFKNAKNLSGIPLVNLDFLRFLDQKPEILQVKDKEYKDDLFCSFEAEVDEEKHTIKLDSLKLLKHNGNLAYNLRCIEFLREHTIFVKKRNENKPIQIKLIYLSF